MAVADDRTVLALVEDLILVDRPHGEVGQHDVSQRDDVGTADYDGTPRQAVVHCARPVLESQTTQSNGAGVRRCVGFPVLIDI